MSSSTHLDFDLKIKRTIPNSDYALPLALSYAALQSDIDFLKALEVQETDPTVKQRLSDESKVVENKLRSLKRYDTPQVNAVKELLQSAGLDYNGYESSEDHLDSLASVLSEYHIKLFFRIPPAKVYSLKWEANPDEDKKLCIVVFNGNFDAFTPTRKSIGKSICPLCHETYLKKDRHGCKKKCKQCRRPGCSGGPSLTPTIKCECGYYFDRKDCYDAHKVKRGAFLSVCERFKYCHECKKGYRADRWNHECGKSQFCVKCGLWKKKSQVHKCCWEPPSDEEKQKKLEKQAKFRIVFYDFESVQLNNPDDPDSVGQHWVNYAAYSMVCHECITQSPESACAECGPLKRGQFGYLPGDEKNSVPFRFVDFLFSQPNLNNAIAVAHNGGKYDLHFLVEIFLKKQFRINIAKTGMKLMRIEAKFVDKTIIFKDSYLFMPIALSKLPSAFGFEDKCKGTFPYLFNHPVNYGKVMPSLPAKAYYHPSSMKKAAFDEFKVWYDENEHKGFNFDEEIRNYCINDVDILHQGVVKYIQTCLDLFKYNPIIHCVTFASYSFFIIKNLYMKPHQIGIIPEHGFVHNDIQSPLAIKYIKWLEYKHDIEYHHFLRGPEYNFQFKGRKIKVDAYHAGSNTVVEVLGCFWHGCKEHTDHNSKHPVYKDKTYRQVYGETEERLQMIRDAGYSLVVVWEHAIKNALDGDKEMRAFFDSVFHKKRLNIRDGFFGGRTQNFVLKASPDRSKGQTIDHIDVTSMYPALLRKTPMPVGQPTVITSGILPITLPLPYQGFYLLDILPPRSLLHPVIPYRVPGKLVFPLCRSCAIAQKNVVCTHSSDDDRFLHVVVWQKELEKALEKGYTVLRVYEVWHWTEWTTGLFKPLMDAYIKIKTEASGPPRSNMTDEELDAYIKEFNDVEGILIEKAKIIKNPAMRYIAKLGMNSPWGKFGEKPIKSEIKFVHESQEVPDEELDPNYEVLDIEDLDEYYILNYRKRTEFANPIPGTSVVIAAITTATGRLILYEALERLQERALYCDTDSAVMIVEPGKDNLEDLRGTYLGKWSSELPEGFEIIDFVSSGPKVYSYKYANRVTGELREITKARGIVQSIENVDQVKFSEFDIMVKSLFAEEPYHIHTTSTLFKKDMFGVESVVQNKVLRPVMNKSLYFADYSTLPYGYEPPAKRKRV